MMKLACDLCGKTLMADEDVRYVVRIEVFAAADPMELTEEDLKKDLRKALRELVARMEHMDPEEAQDQVYRCFHFELCPGCQRKYLKDPLRRGRQETMGNSETGPFGG
jgi:DNA-binding GntR family transcriptional regulator